MSSVQRILMIEQRVFEQQLLLSLVDAGVLSREQAAGICTKMTEELHFILDSENSAMSKAVLPSLIEKWEDIAANVLGQKPPPKGS